MILDAITKTIEIDLAEAHATSAMYVTVDYIDLTTTTTTPGSSDSVSNGTTAATIVSAPAASTQRKVNFMSIQNADTVSHVTTIQLNNNTTLRPIVTVTLNAGDTLQYNDVNGWRVLDTTGHLKTSQTGLLASYVVNTPAGNIASTTVQAAINELDTEKAALSGAAFTGPISAPNMVGRNRIINGRFNVNQSGAASKTAAVGYNYDRWYFDGTYLYQGIEEANIEDGTFVVSWLTDATCQWQLVSTATAAAAVASGWAGTAVANGGAFTLSATAGNNLWVRFAAGTAGLNALTDVQVERGTVATPFEFRHKTIEEDLCCRYKFVPNTNDTYPGFLGANYITVTIPFRTTMRAAPSIVSAAPVSIQSYNNSASSTSVSLNVAGVDSVSIVANGGTWTAGQGGRIILTGTIIFSAEL